MIIIAILWMLVGVFFSWESYREYTNGIIPSIIGIVIPIYLWLQFNIPNGIALAIYPITAFLSHTFLTDIFGTVREGSFYDEHNKKQAAEAATVNPVTAIMGHIDAVKRGIR